MDIALLVVGILALIEAFVILSAWKPILERVTANLKKGKVFRVIIFSKTMTHFTSFLVPNKETKFTFKGLPYYIIDNEEPNKAAVVFDTDMGLPTYIYIEGNPTPISIDKTRDVVITPDMMDNLAISIDRYWKTQNWVEVLKSMKIVMVIAGITLLAVLGLAYYIGGQLQPHMLKSISEMIKQALVPHVLK